MLVKATRFLLLGAGSLGLAAWTVAHAACTADSVLDWKTAGSDPLSSTDKPDQGHADSTGSGRWFYGYYATAGDSASFTLLPDYREDTTTPDWYFVEAAGHDPTGAYTLGDYPLLLSYGGHPGASLQAVRRWLSDANGLLHIDAHLTHLDPPYGNGVIGSIFVNGLVKDSSLVANGSSYSLSLDTVVGIGDAVDFVLDNNGGYDSDSTLFTAQMTLIPESEAASLLVGLGLAGFALWRRPAIG